MQERCIGQLYLPLPGSFGIRGQDTRKIIQQILALITLQFIDWSRVNRPSPQNIVKKSDHNHAKCTNHTMASLCFLLSRPSL
jgi:hypothetical protein